jgi:hypothetical protein
MQPLTFGGITACLTVWIHDVIGPWLDLCSNAAEILKTTKINKSNKANKIFLSYRDSFNIVSEGSALFWGNHAYFCAWLCLVIISISGELESYSAYRKNQKYHIFKPVVSLSALPTSRGHLWEAKADWGCFFHHSWLCRQQDYRVWRLLKRVRFLNCADLTNKLQKDKNVPSQPTNREELHYCQRQSKSGPKGSAKCCHFGVGIIAA